MYGLLKKIVANKRFIQERASSVEEAMNKITGEEEIGTGALKGQGFLYILMHTHKSWASYFKLDFLTRLGKEWSNLGHKGLPSKPHMSLVSQCPLMSYYNLKYLKTTDGKIFST